MKYCCESMEEAVEGGHFPGSPSVIVSTSKLRCHGVIINSTPDNHNF
jgi:hypothetical protein